MHGPDGCCFTTYHRFIQLGLIAQGIMLVLAATVPQLIRKPPALSFRRAVLL